MHPVTCIYDTHQHAQPLAEKLNQGGEGVIYPLQQRSDVLLKHYMPEVLQKRGASLPQKIEAMRSLETFRKDSALAWPLISAYNASQQWVGYCMYRAKGVPMAKLAHAMLYPKYFPSLDRRRLVGYLLNLVKHVQRLHQQQVMIGDYNLNNILCDPDSEQVTLIDCDSYQLSINGHFYPCPVGSADMTPKEHQNKPFAQIKRTEQSEVFSLAIILFKALMLGRHPYDIVGGNDPVHNILTGTFAYGLGNSGIPKGRWYNIWSHMPHRLKTLFIKTFEEGAANPANRPCLSQWLEALELYRREIDKGWHCVEIQPAAPKTSEYRGSQSHA